MPRPIQLVAALIMAALPACGGDGTGPDGNDPNTITLTTGLRFSPADLTVDPGTTVRWVSNAALDHTVTPANAAQAGVWTRVATSVSGTVLTHTFTVSGQVYNYFCEPHQASGMTGIIRVR